MINVVFGYFELSEFCQQNQTKVFKIESSSAKIETLMEEINRVVTEKNQFEKNINQ